MHPKSGEVEERNQNDQVKDSKNDLKLQFFIVENIEIVSSGRTSRGVRVLLSPH